jgi:hypothetical protein
MMDNVYAPPAAELRRPEAPAAARPFFHRVSVPAFCLLSFASVGLYPVYWAFQCWRYVKRRDGRGVWPIIPALFLPFTSYLLLREIEHEAGPVLWARPKPTRRLLSGWVGSGGLAILYFVFSRLAFKQGLLGFIGLLAFVFLVPGVHEVAEVHRLRGNPVALWGLRWWQWLLASLGVVVIVAMSGEELGFWAVAYEAPQSELDP